MLIICFTLLIPSTYFNYIVVVFICNNRILYHNTFESCVAIRFNECVPSQCRRGNTISITSRVPVEGKSSVCVLFMKYRIIVLIIIIISMVQIILSYMANTSRTHACTHAHTRTRTG